METQFVAITPLYAAIKNKYVWIIRDATILLYKITLSLLEEKYLLELNFDKDIKDIINSISSFFTKFFKTYEDLDFDLFDEILDVLTLMAFHCMKFNKHDLTNLILGNLLTLSSQVATFDKDGYSMVSVAKRIMMIGVLSVEVNAYEVIPKVLELINSLDSNAKTLTRFSPRVTADELETEIKEYDIMFNLSKDTPESYLKGKITDYAWFKFRSMLNNR